MKLNDRLRDRKCELYKLSTHHQQIGRRIFGIFRAGRNVYSFFFSCHEAFEVLPGTEGHI